MTCKMQGQAGGVTFNETSHILPVIIHPEVPDKCPTLTAKMQGQTGWAPYNETSHLLPVAFTRCDYGGDAMVDCSPTIRCGKGGEAHPAVAFTQNQRDELRVLGDKVGALSASHGTHQTNYIAQPVAFNIREDAVNNTFHCKPVDTSSCVTALRPSPMGHHAQEFIVHPLPIAFDERFMNSWTMENCKTVPTLMATDYKGAKGVATIYPIPIQDGREIEKKQNGLGIGGPGDKAYTLDTTGAQAVAQPKVQDGGK